MRVRYSMVDSFRYQAECDLPEKKARVLFDELKDDKHCAWAELVSEDDDTYMNIIDEFDHRDAYELYKAEMQVKEVMKEIFG